MATDCNSCNNSNLMKETEKCIKDQHENGTYLVVDNGEQILLDMEEARLELQKQIVTLLEKVCLLWDIVRRSIIFVFPVLAGIFISLMSNQFLPKDIALWISTLMFTLTLGLIFINLEPLNEAISAFLSHQMYVPHLKGEELEGETNAEEHDQSPKEETLKPTAEFELD